MFLRCTLRRQRVNRQYSTSAIPTLGEYLKRIGECDSGEGGTNAFVSIDSTEGLVSPTTVSKSLAGKSIAIKDVICTSALPTTCSSEILRDFRPPYDATIVRLLNDEDATVIGKTNCDEFGMGSMNIHTSHGSVINPFQTSSSKLPWRKRERRSAGGSSGGSAAAVAASMCYAALSTDTGGSTRLPASYCGIVGLKPSYGLISRWGVVSFADSLDCVGIMADRVSRIRSVFDVLAQFDGLDPTSIPIIHREQVSLSVRSRMKDLGDNGRKSLQGLVVGIPLVIMEYFPAEMSPYIYSPFNTVLSVLRQLGASIEPVSLPSTRYSLSAYYVIASAEAYSNLARYDGIRYGAVPSITSGVPGTRMSFTPSHPCFTGARSSPEEGSPITDAADVYALTRSRALGAEVKRRILLGSYALTAGAFDNYFLQAQRVRNLVRTDFDRVFRISNALAGSSSSTEAHGAVDVILHPSAIRTAPSLVPKSTSAADGLQVYVQDVLTVPASLAGIPALSVPMGYAEDDGWPVGVSVVGQWGSEELVMNVGEAIEHSLRIHNQTS